MHAVRCVICGTLGETITLNHAAHSRDTFVRGALHAAEWLINKPPPSTRWPTFWESDDCRLPDQRQIRSTNFGNAGVGGCLLPGVVPEIRNKSQM